MAKTGELGADFADLSDIELGSTQVLGDVVENTSGLILLYKCDDPAAQATLAEKFGKNATVNLGTTAYTAGVSGAVDSAITTPSATPASPTKDTTPHLSFDYTGADINIGTAGTIEMWYKPAEFGDPVSISPALAAVDYEILRLVQAGGSGSTIQFMGGIASGSPIIRAQFTPTAGSGTLLSDAFATDPGSTESLTKPIHPKAEVGRWYYLVFTWDTSGTQIYCNGNRVDQSFGASHPPSITIASLHFGKCGGTYDSVAIINRKFTSAEVSGRFTAGQSALPAPGARMTSYFTNYAATYNANVRVTQARLETLRNGNQFARVTNQQVEVLRTGSRQLRITNQFVEVLRSVAVSSIDRTLTDTLTFTQTAIASVVRSATVSQTLGFTETLLGGHDFGVTVNQTLGFTETVTKSKVSTQSLSQTLTFSEIVFRTIDVSTTQTLAFTETVSSFVAKLITQTLAFTDTATATVVHNRSLLQSINFTETIGLNRDFAITVTDTLPFTETVSKSRVITRGVLQVLNLVQSQVSYVTHEGVDHLAFTQSVSVYLVKTATVSQTLAFTQSTSVGFIRSVHLSHSLVFSQFVMGNPYLGDAPRDAFLADSELGDLMLAEIDGEEDESGADLLEFNETVGLQRIFYRAVTQTLAFTDSAIRGPIIWDRRITQTLGFFENHIPTDLQLSTSGTPAEYSKPVAIITKVSRIVVISSRYQSIVLPTPEFNDSEKLGNVVDVKRSMTGKVYTYVKTADWSQLNYDFTLTRKKALELREFVKKNLSEVLDIINWKGQIYKGQFTNSPITFNTSGRYKGSYEKVAVTLEIEGVRIHG